LYVFLVLLLVLSWGCGTKSPVEENTGVAVSELPGTTYGVAILDEHGSTVLLGRLRFDTISEETITGTWLFETWGEQPEFPGFAVNTGGHFPEGVPVDAFSGRVFGDMVILRVPLPVGDRVLGIVIDEQDGNRLFGPVNTLPDQKFSGRIDAVRDIPAH